MRYACILAMMVVSLSHTGLKGVSLPRQPPEDKLIKDVPWADEEKIVDRVFPLKIPGFYGAYNPSIVKCNEGFILSFRYEDKNLLKSFVGLVRLDKQFRLIGIPVVADFTYEHQDVRLFWYKGGLFAVSSRIISMRPAQCPISLSQVDLETLTFKSVVDLEYHPQVVEKNWVPIVHTDATGEESLYLVYSHNPLHILRVSSLELGTVEQPTLLPEKRNLVWEEKWGKIRGGTPCTCLGEEQLAIFHSAFNNGERWCWVIGAMMFDNSPPFSITKISPYPIVAHGMYTTKLVHRFRHRTFKVAFPGGFVEEKEGGKTVLYLVYGENDSGIKVMVLDKERLLASLKDFKECYTIPDTKSDMPEEQKSILNG